MPPSMAWRSLGSPELAEGGCLGLCDGRSAAGNGFDGTLASREAVRLLTGAPLSASADTLVPIEGCSFDSDRVEIPAGLARGANRRGRGEDVLAGTCLLNSGIELGP
jgi:molybdopterin molybdotransferase